MLRPYMGSHIVGRVHQGVIVVNWPVSILPVVLKLANDGVRILVVLIMLKVMVFVVEEAMRFTIGANG